MNGFPADAYAVVGGWSALEAVGPDAGKFLQSFCTNDVLKLADGRSCEAMFTDVKAHVVAYAWVMRSEVDRYVVLLSSGRAERLLAHLDRYLIREKVELTVASARDWTLGRGVEGELAVPVESYGAGIVASIGAALPAGRQLTPDEFAALRIGLGVPLDGVDVDERNLPQEVDRNDRTISFTKGCYLGQEPVARIDALGRVNWLLRRLRIEGPAPEPGSELTHEGKAVGRITSSVAIERGSIALGYVRREHSAVGVRLSLNGVSAEVLTG